MFNTKGCNNYVHRALPTGARPVPVNEEGKRKCGAWNFTMQDGIMQTNSTVEELPPETYSQRKFEFSWMRMCSQH